MYERERERQRLCVIRHLLNKLLLLSALLSSFYCVEILNLFTTSFCLATLDHKSSTSSTSSSKRVSKAMSVVGVGGRSASGAELIRQLSTAKLEHYSSTESLKRSPSTKTPPWSTSSASVVAAVAMGKHHAGASSAYGDRPSHHRPVLMRQSTTTSETVSSGTGLTSTASRRQLLSESRKNWRSCDDRRHHHHQAHLMQQQQYQQRQQQQHHRPATAVGSKKSLAGGSLTTIDDAVGSLDLPDKVPSDTVNPLPKEGLNLHNAQVYYYSKTSQVTRADQDPIPTPEDDNKKTNNEDGGASSRRQEGGEREERVVLPSLNQPATRLNSTGSRKSLQRQRSHSTGGGGTPAMTIAVVVPQRVLAKASDWSRSTGKSVLGLASGKSKAAKTLRPVVSTCSISSAGSLGAATSAISVVGGGLATGTTASSASGAGSEINGRSSLTAIALGHRRRLRGMIILTTFILFLIALFLVGITLRMAPLIDELGKMHHHTPTVESFSNSSPLHLLCHIS